MPKTEDSKKTIVVTGDVTIDWNLARRAPAGIGWGGWHPDLKARARAQRGGAALLADLVEAVLARGEADGPKPEILRMADPVDPATPDVERFSHSYAVWVPCEARRGERRRVWRVEPPIGLDRARTGEWAQEEWGRLVPDFLRAEVIALDDANLGFRRSSDPELWRQVAAGGRKPWVLLKASRPVAEGPLWEHLREHLPERVVALMTIDDLRGAAVRISRELSWERTAQDLYWELVNNPLVNGLSLCAHVVVSFGAAGAALLSRIPSEDGDGPTRCRLLFDPELIEGAWEDERPGAVIGTTSCLAAALARELAFAGEEPDLAGAINSGVAAGRRLYEEGYGEAEDGMDVAFPMSPVVEAIAAGDGPLECAEVPDPAAVLPHPPADGAGAAAGERDREENPPEAEGLWTILEDRYTDDLRGVATEVALRGPEVALEAVPLGRFGKLLSVDRGEIESFRSVRALIAEYCRGPRSKPLSIAVFGPPGAGKSFAIEQVACSVAPELISEPLEFNLSQFGSLDDLIDALHRVRDVGLGGKVPLVFWDEFDSPLEGGELGWLRYFLAPMQDGEFRHGQLVHPIGRGIFVFAGGTSARMEGFRDRTEQTEPSLKAADFLSRLKGYVEHPGARSTLGGGRSPPCDPPGDPAALPGGAPRRSAPGSGRASDRSRGAAGVPGDELLPSRSPLDGGDTHHEPPLGGDLLPALQPPLRGAARPARRRARVPLPRAADRPGGGCARAPGAGDARGLLRGPPQARVQVGAGNRQESEDPERPGAVG